MSEDDLEALLDESVESEEPEIEADDDEADSPDGSSDKGDSKKRFKLNLSRKTMIILVASILSVIIFVTGGIIAWKMMGDDSPEEVTGKSSENGDKESLNVADIDLPVPDLEKIVQMEPFKIPLTDDAGDWELNVTIEVEVSTERVKDELEKRIDEIREAVLPVLSKRRPNQLQNVASKIELRTELIKKINQMLKRGKVRNIYFTQFVVL